MRRAPRLESEASTDAALRAELYAAVHTGTPGDLAFHRAACAGAERVLELGCGHGRLARALAEAGHQVVGVDLDEALLSLAARKRTSAAARARIELRRGDVRALSEAVAPTERFERVVIAYSTLYCLGSDDEVRAMLRGARAHLAPGGRVVLDAYAADAFHARLDPDEQDPFEQVARVHVRGESWRVLERSDWDRAAQRLTAFYRHEPVAGGPAVETSIAHRYLLLAQLCALLASEGLRPILIAGGFDERPYDDDAEQLVVVAERA